MNSTSFNHAPVKPLKTHINIQFEHSQPIELMIKSNLKNSKQPRGSTPSLFQIAANLDDSSWSPKAKKAANNQAPQNWIFSRERLENALKEQISGYRKHYAGVQTAAQPTRVAKQTGSSAAGSLPTPRHLIQMANMVEEAA